LFKFLFYKDFLCPEHVVGEEVNINKVNYEDGSDNNTFNFWGYIIEKGGMRYLVSSYNSSGEHVKAKDIFPLKPKTIQRVAHGGNVYHYVRNYDIAKFRPQQHHTMRELVDLLSSIPHSNMDHQKLLWFMALAQYLRRCNLRIATPAGFGKDSTVDILGNLIGGCATIENPSVPKLEERATLLSWLVVNEVVDMTKDKWREVESFLLATGAFKPEITKRTRAAARVGETIDISNFSLSLFYNDIDHYSDYDDYFDRVTKKAVKDRFPAFRLHGAFTHDFNSIHTLNLEKTVKDHLTWYRELIETLKHFEQRLRSYVNPYETASVAQFPKRWQTNLHLIFPLIAMYSETQEEYNGWVDMVLKSLDDYDRMLIFPSSCVIFGKTVGMNAEELKKDSTLDGIARHLRGKVGTSHQLKWIQQVRDAETYETKNYLLRNYTEQEEALQDHNVSFWSDNK